MKSRSETIIIGAGLAGLACANILEKNGREFLILEKSEQVGGRVKTDYLKGFQFDHGFQVLNPGYPQAKNLLNYEALKLNYFDAGFALRDGNEIKVIKDPFRHPSHILKTLQNLPGTNREKFNFAKYLSKVLLSPQGVRLKRTDLTSRAALVEAGVDEELLTKLLRPFLSGVFLESKLETSRIFLDDVLASFFSGTPALPDAGMGAISEQLASNFSSAKLLCNETVLKIEPGIITTHSGKFTAKNIVLATDSQVATKLLGLPEQKVHKVKTWYLLADQNKSEILSGEKILVTDANPYSPLVNSVVLSNIAESYAPEGKALISASAIEENLKLDKKSLLLALANLYQLPTNSWKILSEYEILNALPAMYSPFNPRRSIKVANGLFVAGDHRNFSSIQGALDSGVKAAKSILNLRGDSR